MLIDYRSQFESPPREAPLVLGEVVLRPGNNEVNPTLWKKARSHPVLDKKIRAKMDEGIILIRSEKDASQNLRDLTVTEAAKIIKDTFDVDLLNQWKEFDTRKGVLRDIDDQIELINQAGTSGQDQDDKTDGKGTQK